LKLLSGRFGEACTPETRSRRMQMIRKKRSGKKVKRKKKEKKKTQSVFFFFFFLWAASRPEALRDAFNYPSPLEDSGDLPLPPSGTAS